MESEQLTTKENKVVHVSHVSKIAPGHDGLTHVTCKDGTIYLVQETMADVARMVDRYNTTHVQEDDDDLSWHGEPWTPVNEQGNRVLTKQGTVKIFR